MTEVQSQESRNLSKPSPPVGGGEGGGGGTRW